MSLAEFIHIHPVHDEESIKKAYDIGLITFPTMKDLINRFKSGLRPIKAE